jgi:hypothetical protein
MTEENAIVQTPVLPLVSPEKAAEQWALFEALKAKLLGDQDYQLIQGKRYIKRSGFRKIAVYFGISDRILKEERSERDDGSFTWRIAVEAYAPNGRACVGLGACDSRERKFAHLEHDVYSTAHTRAKSRAISDLVAGGAVSAEEVGETQDEHEPQLKNSSTQPVAEPSQAYVPTVKNTIKMDGLRQFPLTDGLTSVGMLNVLNEQISIVPERPVRSDGPTIEGFLVLRVLDPMVAKHGLSYSIVKTESGDLSYILVTGKLAEDKIKELQSASRWAFMKAMEPASSKQ